MKPRQATLAGGFLVFMILDLIVVTYAIANRLLGQDEGTDLLVKTLTVYSIPFGVIVGGYFGSRIPAPGGGAAVDASGGFWLAVALCSIWNLLLFVAFVIFLHTASSATIQTIDLDGSSALGDLKSYIDKVTGQGLFLIAAALAYYFTSDSKTK